MHFRSLPFVDLAFAPPAAPPPLSRTPVLLPAVRECHSSPTACPTAPSTKANFWSAAPGILSLETLISDFVSLTPVAVQFVLSAKFVPPRDAVDNGDRPLYITRQDTLARDDSFPNELIQSRVYLARNDAMGFMSDNPADELFDVPFLISLPRYHSTTPKVMKLALALDAPQAMRYLSLTPNSIFSPSAFPDSRSALPTDSCQFRTIRPRYIALLWQCLNTVRSNFAEFFFFWFPLHAHVDQVLPHLGTSISVHDPRLTRRCRKRTAAKHRHPVGSVSINASRVNHH
ncbi:hypothetical protein B0H14DRAFT_2573702 [Mycena olivaceomarginata]|nr:hypothetical protein B0H14DRAFT_2573702 [Mycena olivaceomarginata]